MRSPSPVEGPGLVAQSGDNHAGDDRFLIEVEIALVDLRVVERAIAIVFEPLLLFGAIDVAQEALGVEELVPDEACHVVQPLGRWVSVPTDAGKPAVEVQGLVRVGPDDVEVGDLDREDANF